MSEQPEIGSFDDFAERFKSLSEEAKSYGMQVVWGLCENDRLTRKERTHFGHHGGICASIGMVERMKYAMIQGDNE